MINGGQARQMKASRTKVAKTLEILHQVVVENTTSTNQLVADNNKMKEEMRILRADLVLALARIKMLENANAKKK